MRTSAGLLLHRVGDEGRQVLLVHPGGPFWARKDDGAWSIPKGEHGPDEDPRAAALREFAEEFGRPASDGPELDLGSVRQSSAKTVRCFAREADLDPAGLRSNTVEIEWPPRSGRRMTVPEVDRAEWFTLASAQVKIVRGQLPLLDRLVVALADAGRS